MRGPRTLAALVLLSTALCAAQRQYRPAQPHRRPHSTPAELKKIRYQIEQQNALVAPADPSPQSQAGFEWGSLAGVAMKLLMGGPVDGGQERTDPIAQMAYMTLLHQNGELTWPKAVSLAMEVALGLLSGGGDAIDRRDTPPSPMENILSAVIAYVTGLEDQGEVNYMAKQASEVIGLLASLLDALRTSFSRRSAEARALASDPWAEAYVASLAMASGLTQSYSSSSEACQLRHVCQANAACGEGAGGTLCEMATYGSAVVLERLASTPRELLTAAGRAGRDGRSCLQLYDGCNRV